ncbi:MAG TPA: hypothetical protein VK206_12935 [Anaerolineales bacterium]|nr:hypothetical protein [Anaerolineales bacterium]
MRSVWAVSSFMALFCFWGLLYVPYIVSGGFVRDDFGFLTQTRGSERYLGWLDQPRGFANYAEFQLFVSSFRTMTGRPVSAILHGFCYWFLGSTSWPYHAINLTLFFVSVLFVYKAIANVTSHELAFITAVFALIYPAASGTVFSSIMMNSNLAGVLWSLALFLDSTGKESESRWRDWVVLILLLLSALSYEAFIPLFMVNILMRVATRNEWKLNLVQLLKHSLPILIALLLLGVYRGFAEKMIFENPIADINVPPLTDLTSRFFEMVSLGIREVCIQSIIISVHSLHNLYVLPLPRLIMVFAGLIILSLSLYTNVSSNENFSQSLPMANREIDKPELNHTENLPWFYAFLAALTIYLISQLIFVFSGYIPNSSGFESRTQGAIRFAVAFLIAAGIKFFYKSFPDYPLKQITILGTISLAMLFTLAIVGQGEAWISAARYNDFLLRKMDSAIRQSKLNEQATFTFIAELPANFPNQVNNEPIFGETWDIAPALSLLYPASNIRANVYEPLGTTIQPDEVIFHGYWEAKYPFYFYRFTDDQIYLIRTAQDFSKSLAGTILR